MSSKPPLNWEIEVLRATLFPTSLAPPGAEKWWQQLTGEEPESYHQTRREGRQEGLYQGRSLTLQQRTGRLDFNLRSAPKEEPGPNRIGPFNPVFGDFVDLTKRWLDLSDLPPVQRIAIGAVLLVPCSDEIEGIRLLEPWIKAVHFQDDVVEDFIYQINRTRTTSVGPSGLKINRLMKWSAVSLHTMEGIMPGGSAIVKLIPTGSILSFARLELDINTDPGYDQVFETVTLKPLFGELAEFLREITVKGECP